MSAARITPPPRAVHLADADVGRLVTAAMATAAARDALVQAASGELASPPRVAVDLPSAAPLFTVGASATAHGFRVYDRQSTEDDQLTAVWHGPRLLGTVTGPELGSRRTGSLGAVAADVLAPPGSLDIGLIGAGRQAWAQVWALGALRPITSIRVFSRNPEQRLRFAERLRAELSIDAHPADSAREAAEGAPVVIVATSSREPVIDVGWLREARHVSTVGPKLAHAHEWPIELADWAELIATDAPDELQATDGHMLAGTRHAGRVQGVGSLILDAWTREQPEMRTLYLSTGLPGSEVILAERLLLTAGEG